MTVILGAGLAGLSCSYHLGHERCLLLEKASHPFGHLHSEILDGYTWDEGPHVSFTTHSYVRELFAASVDGLFEEYPVRTVNYFHGAWIDHPAQSNLFQVPEPLRSQCLADFLASQQNAGTTTPPKNYQEWLEQAFGATFAQVFPAAYTRKYWTVEPAALTTRWIGPRVFRPAVEEVLAGSTGPLPQSTHYIKKVRYPSRGGYQAFAEKIAAGAQVIRAAEVVRIDLRERQAWTGDGRCWSYDRLINTLPLPAFLECCQDLPGNVRSAAETLSCTELLLINVTAPHPTRREGNWFYVYDEDKYSTRIHCTEVLSPHNAPAGCTGVQVEVYESRTRRLEISEDAMAAAVLGELVQMGFIDEASVARAEVKVQVRRVRWANIVFDHQREAALETIFGWLETQGLVREADELDPSTPWMDVPDASPVGALMLAGRFGQWKYYWTDDCVLRGRALGERLARQLPRKS